MTWGSGSWGGGGWGGGGPPFSIDYAVARSTNTVEVGLTQPPLAISPISNGDALNSATWRIYAASPATEFTVLAVAQIDATTFLLRTRQPLYSFNYVHTVETLSLLDASATSTIVAPRDADFRGCLEFELHANPDGGPFDLQNPVATQSGGGYQRHYGADMLRKLIFRRLTTYPGAYFYMREDEYGLGLAVKTQINASLLPTLKVAVEDEVLKEPGITSAAAQTTYANGVLTIGIKATTDIGQEISTSVTIGRQ